MQPIPKFSIVAYLETFGLYVDGTSGRRKVACVYHEDRRPSASVDLDNERYHCFSCEKSGDVLDLIMQEKECDLESALEQAQRTLGDGSKRVRNAAPRRQESTRFRVFEW